MSGTPHPLPASTAFGVLEQRAGILGVPLWRFDAEGRVLSAPSGPAALMPLVDWIDVTRRIDEVARGVTFGVRHRLLEAVPGIWVASLAERSTPERAGVRRSGFVLALLAEQRIRGAAGAGGLGLDWAAAEPFLRKDKAAVEQIAEVLRWTWQDASREELARRTLDQFSDKLGEAYEEINLLFRLAGMVNHAGDPAAVLQQIADESLEILPFSWLALRFAGGARNASSLEGRLLTAGWFPVPLERLEETAAEMMEGNSPQQWQHLRLPRECKLASAVGSEVLAEPVVRDGRVVGAVLAGNKTGDDPDLASGEMRFVRAMAGFLGVYCENAWRFAEQQALFDGILRSLVAAIDAKDPYTRGHSERVALLAREMAIAMRLDARTIEHYRISGMLHDVGKIGVPEAVLRKPGKLSEEEFALIKEHPAIGHTILRDIAALGPMLPGVLHHHERWDGKGYPHGLAGERIPLMGRVLALADTFDAMSSNRAYRPAVSRHRVLAEIQRCSATQFDPDLVGVFLALDFNSFDSLLGRQASANASAGGGLEPPRGLAA